jgi:hypothetical protein
MLQKVIVNTLHYSSEIIQWLCGVFIIFGVIFPLIFMKEDVESIYNSYYNLLGSYWFLRILLLGIISHIIEVATKPFITEKEK